jgi:hypothetical protein
MIPFFGRNFETTNKDESNDEMKTRECNKAKLSHRGTWNQVQAMGVKVYVACADHCAYNFKPKFVRIVTQNPNFLDRVEHVPGSRRNGKNPLFATSASQTHVSHIHFFYTLLLLLLQLWLNTHRKFQVRKVCLRPSQTPSFQRPNHDRTRFFVR